MWYRFHIVLLINFNIRRCSAKSKTLKGLVRDVLFAENSDFVTKTEQEIQALKDKLSFSCKAFSLICLDETLVLFYLTPDSPIIELSIFMGSYNLKVIDQFTCPESTKIIYWILDDEMNSTNAFAVLNDCVWSRIGLMKYTKMAIYNACVLACLLYSCVTWVVNRKYSGYILRMLFKIYFWYQLDNPHARQACHSTWRIPKQMLWGELLYGTRRLHKSMNRCVGNYCLWMK